MSHTDREAAAPLHQEANAPDVAHGWRDESVTFDLFEDGRSLPLRVRPSREGVDLTEWAALNSEALHETLLRYGALLFRGFGLHSAEQFEAFIKALTGELLPYTQRSSPRQRVSGNIYTSTDYPPDQSIFLHNENSYQRSWPLKLFFYCHVAAEQGGETPLAHTGRVLELIRPEVREKFERKKVLYVRNFGNGLGLPWQTVFQTEDKSEVEQLCREAGIEYEWMGHNHLRTRHVREAVAMHPVTGRPVWFNHATFFHPSTLAPEIRDDLLLVADEEDFPYNTFYGDGSVIEPEVLSHLRSVYQQETLSFPWQASDVLMLDNMLVAHGRAPFGGPRKVLVGMSELYSPPTTTKEAEA